MSIEEICRKGLDSNIHINTRYYTEQEESVLYMSDSLHEKYDIDRNDISFIAVVFPVNAQRDMRSYLVKMRSFANKFWKDSCMQESSRLHPDYRPYNSRLLAIDCTPSVRPDGLILYTCDFYKYGITVGHISDDNVTEAILKMLKLSALNPHQCDNCSFGQYVLHDYYFQQHQGITNEYHSTYGLGVGKSVL